MTTLVEASKSKKAAQTKGSKAYDDLRQLRITLMRREREIGLLREEERQLEADGGAYLQTALASCRSCLLAGSTYDLRIVFQLIALWFEYANKCDPNPIPSMIASHHCCAYAYRVCVRLARQRPDVAPAANIRLRSGPSAAHQRRDQPRRCL